MTYISISHTIHRHLFSDFSPFRSPVKEKGKQGRMKGLTMAQWINLNWNNRCVSELIFCILRKTGPILLPLVGLAAGREAGRQADRLADEIQVGFEILQILYRLNYSGFNFVYYHCNVATVLERHFSRLFSSKAYLRCVLKCVVQ